MNFGAELRAFRLEKRDNAGFAATAASPPSTPATDYVRRPKR
jgi:hypothetical protein